MDCPITPYFAKLVLPREGHAPWKKAGNTIVASDTHPLVIKGTYVLGVIYNICESVDCLLKHDEKDWLATSLPAFGICASGIELLGRCLRGDQDITGTATKNLKKGFDYLFKKSQSKGITTRWGQYDIPHLIALRHFAAHGQADAIDLPSVKSEKPVTDIDMLHNFPELIGNAIEDYWSDLWHFDDCCENLAKANVRPLRSEPIRKMWAFFKEDISAGAPFYDFQWRISFE